MSYAPFAFILIFLALILTYLRNHYTYWANRGVPQEDPSYVLGNCRGLGQVVHFRDVQQRIYLRFKRANASFVGIYVFFTRAALITDLDLAKQILDDDFMNFHDRGLFHNIADDPLTAHLFTLEGSAWQEMHEKLSPVFREDKLKFVFPTLVDVGDNLTRTCDKMLNGTVNGILDVRELSDRFTIDVIGSCAFGVDCNSLNDPQVEFRRKARSILEKPRHSHTIQGFIAMYPKLAKQLGMKLYTNEVSEYFISTVKRTVDQRIQNQIRHNDFLDLLLEINARVTGEKTSNVTSDNGDEYVDLRRGLSLLQVAAQSFVFFVIGYETSSTTMSLCLYELALQPHIQDRLRTEIKTVLKAYNGKLSYEALNEMYYLDKVVSETLRKYPVRPHLVRQAIHDYSVPNTSLVLEKGTTIFIPIYALHHDPDLYPDPETFDPLRFDETATKSRHPYAYLPFGDGPRNCMGMRFGKMQTKIGLVSLLQSYSFSITSRTRIPVTFNKSNLLLTPTHGIYLNATHA